MNEHAEFDKALAAWLNSQDVEPKIAVPVLAIVIGNKIGERARKDDVEDFCNGLSKTQELILATAVLRWTEKIK